MRKEKKFKLVFAILLAVALTKFFSFLTTFIGYFVHEPYMQLIYGMIFLVILFVILLLTKKAKINLILIMIAALAALITIFPYMLLSKDSVINFIAYLHTFILNLNTLCISYFVAGLVYKNIYSSLDIKKIDIVNKMKKERLLKLTLSILLAVTFGKLMSYFFLYVGYIISEFYIIQNYIVIALPILLVIILVIKKTKIEIIIIPVALVVTVVGNLSSIIMTDNIQSTLIQVAGILIMNLTLLGWAYITANIIHKRLPTYLKLDVASNLEQI